MDCTSEWQQCRESCSFARSIALVVVCSSVSIVGQDSCPFHLCSSKQVGWRKMHGTGSLRGAIAYVSFLHRQCTPTRHHNVCVVQETGSDKSATLHKTRGENQNMNGVGNGGNGKEMGLMDSKQGCHGLGPGAFRALRSLVRCSTCRCVPPVLHAAHRLSTLRGRAATSARHASSARLLPCSLNLQRKQLQDTHITTQSCR